MRSIEAGAAAMGQSVPVSSPDEDIYGEGRGLIGDVKASRLRREKKKSKNRLIY